MRGIILLKYYRNENSRKPSQTAANYLNNPIPLFQHPTTFLTLCLHIKNYNTLDNTLEIPTINLFIYLANFSPVTGGLILKSRYLATTLNAYEGFEQSNGGSEWTGSFTPSIGLFKTFILRTHISIRPSMAKNRTYVRRIGKYAHIWKNRYLLSNNINTVEIKWFSWLYTYWYANHSILIFSQFSVTSSTVVDLYSSYVLGGYIVTPRIDSVIHYGIHVTEKCWRGALVNFALLLRGLAQNNFVLPTQFGVSSSGLFKLGLNVLVPMIAPNISLIQNSAK